MLSQSPKTALPGGGNRTPLPPREFGGGNGGGGGGGGAGGGGVQLPPGAVIVQGDGFFSTQGRQIAELALAGRVATIAWTRSLVDAGCLMSYGQNVGEDAANAANFVDRILRGAKPRDQPVEQPTNPKLVINGGTAKALGLALPPELLLRADRVID